MLGTKWHVLTVSQVWSFSPPSENPDSRAATPISLPDPQEASVQDDTMTTEEEERWQRLATEREEEDRQTGERQQSKAPTEKETMNDVPMQD